MLHDLACPTCGAPGLEAHQPDGLVSCKFCGNKFAQDDRVACPKCEAVNPADSSFCKDCGERLKRPCPACGTENWAGADYCARCGHNLNQVEAMARRQAQGFKGTLQEQRTAANALKEQEERDSQKRMAGLWEAEHKRQEVLIKQHAEQQRQQTRLLIVTLSLAAVFVVVLVATLILTNR